ncbi:MAG: hypothetical protein P4L57_11245 [Rhizomicrobium sp.]|nr:hypothetical protein [Rhizomicrobium sp.]
MLNSDWPWWIKYAGSCGVGLMSAFAATVLPGVWQYVLFCAGGVLLALGTIGAMIHLWNIRRGKRMLFFWAMVVFFVAALVCAAIFASQFWGQTNHSTAEIDDKVFVGCQRAIGLPNSIPEGLHTVQLFPNHYDNKVVGVQEFPPNDHPNYGSLVTETIYKCQVVNYTAETLTTVDVVLNVEWRQAFQTVRENQTTTIWGEITKQQIHIVPIDRLDPGSDNAYTFYIWNQSPFEWATITVADEATMKMIGRNSASSGKLRVVADPNMYFAPNHQIKVQLPEPPPNYVQPGEPGKRPVQIEGSFQIAPITPPPVADPSSKPPQGTGSDRQP